jgi:hypothetical protein
MFSSIGRWLSGEAPAVRDPIEVFAVPMCHADRGRGKAMRVLFTDDERWARDPIYLKKMIDRVWELDEEADMHELGRNVRNMINWTFPDFQQPLSMMPEGFNTRAKFYAVDIVVPGKVLDAGYRWEDINAGILRLEFDGTQVTLLGAVPAENVMRRRLQLLRENGARRVNAWLVHANNGLFVPGEIGGPALVVFSFDRSTPRPLLEEIADFLHERDLYTEDPEILAAFAEVSAGEKHATYHHRFRIPRGLANEHDVFASDLWIHRPYLRKGQFFEDDDDEEEPDDRILPCLAEPGEKGGIEMLPWDEEAVTR